MVFLHIYNSEAHVKLDVRYRPVTEGGWCVHAWILGLLTFFASSDLYFTVTDGGVSESAAKLP